MTLTLLRYGLGLLASGIAVVVAILLRPLLDPAYSLPTIAAAAITAWYVGLGPALVVSGLGALAGALLSAGAGAPPGAAEGLPASTASAAQLATSTLLALLISALLEHLRRSRARIAATADSYAGRLEESERLLSGILVETNVQQRLEDERDELRAAATSRADERDRAYYQGVLDGVRYAVVLIDARERCIDANAQAERLFGRSREELLQQGVRALLLRGPAWTAADREDFIRKGHWRGALQVQGTDGSTIPVELDIARVTLDGEVVHLTMFRERSPSKPAQQLEEQPTRQDSAQPGDGRPEA